MVCSQYLLSITGDSCIVQYLKNLFSQPKATHLGQGFLGNVPEYYGKLHNDVLQEFLCITITDSDTFIHFAKHDNGIVFDFPLVNKQHSLLKGRMTSFFAEAGLPLLGNKSGVVVLS